MKPSSNQVPTYHDTLPPQRRPGLSKIVLAEGRKETLPCKRKSLSPRLLEVLGCRAAGCERWVGSNRYLVRSGRTLCGAGILRVNRAWYSIGDDRFLTCLVLHLNRSDENLGRGFTLVNDPRNFSADGTRFLPRRHDVY